MKFFAHVLPVLLVVSLVANAHDKSDDFIFAAIGDGPYAAKEWKVFEDHLVLVNKAKRVQFLAHVGDIWHSSPALPSKHYTRVADMLKTSKKPVFIIPGDNEWNDLQNPDVGWSNWEREFMGFEKNFSKAPKTEHQEERPENFVFVKDGVLFIGINLVGGRVHDEEEWKLRLSQDASWVKEQLEAHKSKVRSAVVLGHAQPADSHTKFFEKFTGYVRKFRKPVLYLHGDGHNFDVKYPWRESNLWKVQIDSIGKNVPLYVRVTHDIGEPFRFNRYALEK
jgi:hypothetical protein